MTGEFGGTVLKMMGSLVLILGLIIFLSYWLKRLRPGTVSAGRNPAMRLVGTLNLAPKKAVALIEVCDQWFLVGVGTESVSMISKLDPPPQEEQTEAPPAHPDSPFYAILKGKRLLQPRRGTAEKGNESES